MTIDAIFEGAMALPPEDRAALAEKLLGSLGLPSEEEVDRAWVEEAEKRLRSYKEGTLKAVPGDEVFRSLPHRRGR